MSQNTIKVIEKDKKKKCLSNKETREMSQNLNNKNNDRGIE